MIIFIESQSSQSGCKRDYIVGLILNKLHVNIKRLFCRFPSMQLRFLGEHSFNRFFRQSRKVLPFAEAQIHIPINRSSTNSQTKRSVCDKHLCIKIKVIATAAHNKQLAQFKNRETRAVVLRAGKYVIGAKRGIASSCCQARENVSGGEREQTRVKEVATGFRFLILLLFCD